MAMQPEQPASSGSFVKRPRKGLNFWSRRRQTETDRPPPYAKIEIKIKSVSLNTGDVEQKVIYGTASRPINPGIIPWWPLFYTFSSDNRSVPTVSELSRPHIIIHRLSVSKSETISTIYNNYARSSNSNLKLLLILARNLYQEHLDELSDVPPLHATIVIIPKKSNNNDDLVDYLKGHRDYEASMRPILNPAPRMILPKVSKESLEFKKKIQEIVQNRTCVSTAVMQPSSITEPPLRYLKWIVDSVCALQNLDTMELAGSGVLTETIELLSYDHFDVMFPVDFIFFFTFAYSAYEFNSQYSYQTNVPINGLIHKCVSRLLELPPSNIIEQQRKFLELGTFDIYQSFNGLEVDIFRLSAESFLKLGKLFATDKQHSRKFAQTMILSASIYLKFSRSAAKPMKTEDLWKNKVIKYFMSNGIDQADIESFKKGLESMLVILEGNPMVMLTWKDVSSIFTEMFHSLVILRNFIDACFDSLTRLNTEATFINEFLKPVTAFYEKSQLKLGKSDDSSVKEGIKLICDVVNIVGKRNWDINSFTESLNKWITIFVTSIDLSHPDSKSQIELLLSQKFLWSDYERFLNEQLKRAFLTKCEYMSLSAFNNLMSIADFDKTEIIKRYISHVIVRNVTITDEPLKSLLYLSSLCLVPKGYIEEMTSFLQKIESCYIKDGRHVNYIKDLLQIKIISSDSFEEEFLKMLKSLLTSGHQLQKAVHCDIFEIYNDLSVGENRFNLAVMNTLIEEIFSSFAPTVDVMKGVSTVFNESYLTTEKNYLKSVKVLSAVSIFVYAIKWIKLDTISCLRDHCESLQAIAESLQHVLSVEVYPIEVDATITLFTFHEAVQRVPEFLKAINFIMNILRHFSNETSFAIETKEITFGHLQILEINHNTYQKIYRCALMFFGQLESLITKEDILMAKSCVKRIQNQLVKFPKNYPKLGSCHVNFALQKNDISLPEVLSCQIAKNFIPSSNGAVSTDERNTQLLPIYVYEARDESILSTLEFIADQLEDFLEPISESLETLLFLELNDCETLQKCINFFRANFNQFEDQTENFCSSPSSVGTGLRHHQSDPKVYESNLKKKMIKLNCAVKKSEEFMFSLIEGRALMLTVTQIFNIHDQRTIKWSVENNLLYIYYCKLKRRASSDTTSVDINCSLLASFELMKAYEYVLAMKNTCLQFNLQQCLSDLTNIIRKVNYVKQALDTSITTHDACYIMTDIKEFLGVEEIIDNSCFLLFNKIRDGHLDKLNAFACERGYNNSVDGDGMQRFRQEYQLVTTALLHEEHDGKLLSTLQNAMGLLFPFLKTESSFLKLWNDVCQIPNLSEAISSLQFVNQGLGLIKTWFDNTHGEFPKNNEMLLEGILSSGQFCFTFSKEGVQMMLKFTTTTIRGGNGSFPFDNSQLLFEDYNWPVSKINEFSQQLSFVNYEQESFSDICTRWFPDFRKYATDLFNTYAQLHSCGHPNYGRKTPVKIYSINPSFRRRKDELSGRLSPGAWRGNWTNEWTDGWVQLTEELERAKKLLKSFNEKFESCRSQYPWLSFLSSQKLNFLYEKLLEEYIDAGTIVNEVGFLFSLDLNLISSLEIFIKSLDRNFAIDRHPAEVIGLFMETLVNDATVKSYLTDCIDSSASFESGIFEICLISAFNFTNRKLMDIILWIFKKIPSYFQLLRCSPDTTEEDIQLFFERIKYFQERKYLIMGINLLRNSPQRVLLRSCFKLRSRRKKISIFLIEYSPSLFRHIPWITNTELTIDEAEITQIEEECKKQRVGKEFRKFEVVYGAAGSGKTSYIKDKIKCHEAEYKSRHLEAQRKPHVTISINETFKRSEIFDKLVRVPLQSYDMLYYFNISLFLPHESDKQELKDRFNQLVDDINWFFFDLFILGYVEMSSHSVPSSNYSLCLPTRIATSVYIEVPYWHVSGGKVKHSFAKFKDLFPALTLLGDRVTPKKEFDSQQYEGVELVCKYMRASEKNALNHLYSDHPENYPPVTIETVYRKKLTTEKCNEILERNFPLGIKGSKILECLYLKYMERRCRLLEKCYILSYLDEGVYHEMRDEDNELIEDFNPKYMRPTLFELMKEEARDFCDTSVLDATDKHQQVIYDLDKDGGVVFKVFCTGEPVDEKLQKLKAIGVKIKPMTMQLFHNCLSAALNIKKDASNRISLVKKEKFVLTKDFVRKMLIINERKECGIPVVIEGETGVGKTYLLNFLSSLWNDSWNQQLDYLRDKIKSHMAILVSKMKPRKSDPQMSNLILQVKIALDNDEKLSFDSLCRILSITEFHDLLYDSLKETLQSIRYDPILVNIDLESEKDLMDYFHLILSSTIEVEAMAHFINGVFCGKIKTVFYKKSLDAATTPKEIENFLLPIDQQARSLLGRYNDYIQKVDKSLHCYEKPTITVFLDEINTCSCPGYIKEVVIDKTVNGIPIAENIFIVAACNPHRGNSLAAHARPDDDWLNSSYYVQSLPSTLNILRWNYKQLKPEDETEYIREMFQLLYENKEIQEYNFLTTLIAKGQKLVREYAYNHLKKLMAGTGTQKPYQRLHAFEESPVNDKAANFADSTVSQRDIQRVFTLYGWLENWFQKPTKYGHESDRFHISVRALFVSLALVYYFRLNETDRNNFKNEMCIEQPIGSIPPTFAQCLKDELDWVGRVFELPIGIAPTDALKENIYAILICTMVRIPVLIVGPPGSSKTLSFKIVVDNCQGLESKHKELRDMSIFRSLDPHPYQCSRKSTSKEIETVFERAINHQFTNDPYCYTKLSVVLMDEAGLPEGSHESMKVLHVLLDDPKVSFVGISNEVLDAAKTNRTVTVYRTGVSSCDLVQLAKYSLTLGNISMCPTMEEEQIIKPLVDIYENLMDKPHMRNFFGLRDFIHFFTYLGRAKSHPNDTIKPQSVIEALEHNFNGTKDFKNIVQKFFRAIGFRSENVQRRSIVEIMRSSFNPKEKRDLASENQIRYKLFIDSSEDQSLVRLLFQFDIMNRDMTKIHSCSRFPCDVESQKLYTTAAIKHSAMQGDTTLIYQAEEIQESFYDLFNQRFMCINDPKTGEKLLYANVAIGTIIKPTRVGSSFNCAVILSESEKARTNKPFLNRFEKYYLSHEVIFNEMLSHLQEHVKRIMIYAKNKVNKFVDDCGSTSFYGLVDQTIDSLLLTVIPRSRNELTVLIEPVDNPESSCCKLELFAKCLQHCFESEYGVYIDVGQYLEFYDAVKYALDSISHDQTIDDFIKFINYSDMMIIAESTVKNIEASIECPEEIYQFSVLLIQELLVIHLQQQLLQLMTPEALVICNGTNGNDCMDKYYTKCYLNGQDHFSLGNLINKQFSLCSDRAPFAVKKFLCYLRTSQSIIEIIPNQFSCRNVSHTAIEQELSLLQDFLHFDEDKRIHTYAINSSTSQETLLTVLRSFFQCRQSKSSEVLLLVADMNELNKEIINHARILIEEAECSYYSQLQSNKLVFLLLHFPPSMFYNHCYPTLFLNGWSHVYIGRAGEVNKDSSVDIEKWLVACLLQKNDEICGEHDFVNDMILTEWLSDSTVHCSRSVALKKLKNFPPNDVDIETIRLYFLKILFNSDISAVIKKRFHIFWQQGAMHALTFQIAQYTMAYHSSCSLSHTLQDTIQSSFIDFTVYFLCVMNHHLVIHTVLCEENPDSDIDLQQKLKMAANILSVLSIPNSLQQLQFDVKFLTQKSHINNDDINTSSSPHFPFFALVFDAVEEIINKAFRQTEECVSIESVSVDYQSYNVMNLYQQLDSTAATESDIVINRTVTLLKEVVMEEELGAIIQFAVKVIEDNPQFWDYYMEDAMAKSLTRDIGAFSKLFFSNIMSTIRSVGETVVKFAMLHYHLHIYWIDSKLLFSLRLLDECICGDDIKEEEENMIDLENETSVMATFFNTLYASVVHFDDNYLTKVDKLSNLYYQMMNKSPSSFDSLSVPVKIKWIVLAIVFYIYRTSDLLSESLEELVFSLKVLLEENPGYIPANVLADCVEFNVWHVNEVIIEYYVQHFSNLLTDEEIDWMCVFIDSVMALTPSKKRDCDQLQAKYSHHFRTLLGYSVHAFSSLVINRNTGHPNPLLLFDDRVRVRLSMVIDIQCPNCFTYHPAGYRDCSYFIPKTKNMLNAPICDAYFELVVERIQNCRELSGMIAVYDKITAAMTSESETCQSIKKILAIEKQAVIQHIIELTAYAVLSSTNQQISNQSAELNSILDDNTAVSTLQSGVTDNALILMMRMLQVCRNERILQVKLVDHFNMVSLLTSFECLTHIHNAIQVQALPREHFLPFLSHYCSNRMKIYNEVHASIKKLIKQQRNNIHSTAVDCYSPTDKTRLKKWTFNMSVFLSIYTECVLKNRELASVSHLMQDELFQYLGNEYWCFIDFIIYGIKQSQELKELFVTGESHGQCLIELVAAVLGSPAESSHFWQQLFKPQSIKTDFVPGSMLTGYKKYSNMMLLNEESLTYTYRGALNKQSLLVLHWINNCLMCVSSIVKANWAPQIVTEESILLVAEEENTHEAVQRLKSLWNKIAEDCNLTYDERDSLLFLCVQNIFKVLGTTHTSITLKENWSIFSDANTSEDDSFQALCKYEQLLHNEVFLPAWKSVKSDKTSYARFGVPIATHMRDMKRKVPQLNVKCNDPLNGFLSVILSSTNLHDQNCKLFTLYQFILTRPALNIGAVLLPKLVDLYHWIHYQLRYKVTQEMAKTQTIEAALETLLEQYFPTQKISRERQITEIIREYNYFRRVFGSPKLPDINLGMRFYDLLLANDSQDVLYKAINDIVEKYHHFLRQHKPTCVRSVSSKGRSIPLREVTEESCLFAKHKNFEELLSYRNLNDLREIVIKYCSVTSTERYESDPTMILDCIPEVFQFKMIQEEIVQQFIAHKQEIDMKGFWKSFDFHESHCEQVPQNLLYSSAHYKDVITIIEINYPKLIKEDVTTVSGEGTIVQMYHSLNYNCLVSLCSGLYLLLQIIVQKAPFIDDLEMTANQTVVQFLTTESCNVDDDVLLNIGIKKHTPDNVTTGLDDYHYKLICDARIDTVVCLLTVLQEWLESGFHDFCHLPLHMKTPLEDDIALQLHQWIDDHDNDKIVTDVMNLLFKSEDDLLKAATDHSSTTLTTIGTVLAGKTEDIPECISQMPVQYYVSLHLKLRKSLLRKRKRREESKPISPLIEQTPSPVPISTPVDTLSPVSPRKEIKSRTPPLSRPPPPKNDPLEEVAKTKTALDVFEFMTSHGFPVSGEVDEDTDGEYVYGCLSSDDDMSCELGVESAIDRLRFRILFKRWLSGTISGLGKVTPERIAKLFSSRKKLAQFSQVIIDKKIDGEILKKADIEALGDLGIGRANCVVVQRIIEDIEKEISETYSCPVCQHTCLNPCLMSCCYHHICQDCFKILTVQQKPFTCPVCRCTVVLST